MNKIFLTLLILPFTVVSQTINQVDTFGYKQGEWSQKYPNGNVRYKGQFTPQPQFQGSLNPQFKAVLEKECGG